MQNREFKPQKSSKWKNVNSKSRNFPKFNLLELVVCAKCLKQVLELSFRIVHKLRYLVFLVGDRRVWNGFNGWQTHFAKSRTIHEKRKHQMTRFVSEWKFLWFMQIFWCLYGFLLIGKCVQVNLHIKEDYWILSFWVN